MNLFYCFGSKYFTKGTRYTYFACQLGNLFYVILFVCGKIQQQKQIYKPQTDRKNMEIN